MKTKPCCYILVHTPSKEILSAHNTKKEAIDSHAGLGDDKKDYKIKKTTKSPKDWSMKESLNFLFHMYLEEVSVNNVGDGKIAAAGIGPQGEPPAKKSKILKRKPQK